MLGTGFTISLSVKISVLYRNLEIFGTFGPKLYKCLTNFDWIWINFDRIHKKLRKFENFGRDNGLPVGSKISNRHCNHWLGILFFLCPFLLDLSRPFQQQRTQQIHTRDGAARTGLWDAAWWGQGHGGSTLIYRFFFWQLTKEDTNLI